jgi:hypothetical protein
VKWVSQVSDPDYLHVMRLLHMLGYIMYTLAWDKH